MKRSEINAAIRLALEVLEAHHFQLPPFAHFTPEDWRALGAEHSRIVANDLGWDITDFGSNDFDRIGAVLMTLRNGDVQNPQNGTPYAEKIIIMKPGQCIPLHFHWSKTEDIINRGGGKLAVQLYNALEDDTPDLVSPVRVFCDGCKTSAKPGSILIFEPGESVTLTPRMYHKLWADEDGGLLICGEVSTVNDDRIDNRFAEPVSRFANITEDEAPIRLLSQEYPTG